MTEFILGTAGDAPLTLDLTALVGGHLGIVANSGGGKSGLLRKLLEITRGHIQQIVLDSEDEFYTLRQAGDYVIAGGDGGDAAATAANAGDLAIATLEHGFDLIAQINDLGRVGANEFVDHFLAAMVKAPRRLWRPVLIAIDEAQRFDPKALLQLTEAGRKRGFTAVIATQRLPKLDANVRGDINNWIMGRVGQALDRRNMADQLGMSARAANEELARIAPRHFYAMGPALARDPVLFRVGDVETSMVRPGEPKVPTPPPPEALRELLAELKPSPTEGQEDDPEDTVPADPKAALAKGGEIGRMLKQRDDRIAEIEKALASARSDTAWLSMAIERFNDEMGEVWKRWNAPVNAIMDAQNALFGTMSKARLRPIGRPSSVLDQTIHDWADDDPAEPAARSDTPAPSATPPPGPSGLSAASSGGLPAQAEKMADMLDRIAPARVTWSSLAAMVKLKPRGGHFNAGRKALRDSGRIVEDGEMIRSARKAKSMSHSDAFALWKDVLANPAPAMMDALLRGPMTRLQLGAALGIAARGGHFNNGVAQLVRNRVALDVGGKLDLAEPLPGVKP